MPVTFTLGVNVLDNKHEAIFPPTTNCTLWRYTDLTKLLSLFESRQLYFPRCDQFDDPYEGVLSRAAVAAYREQLKSAGVEPNLVEQFVSNTGRQREAVFISCWYAQEHESAAMWRLYLQSPEGVAIQTDHDALCAQLETSPLSIRTSLVQYIDYEKVVIPLHNILFPFVHKRLSFAHEAELRAIIWAWEDVNRARISEGSTFVAVDVNPQDLIKSVHVSPMAPPWFGGLVEQLVARYGMTIPVIRSSLYERPSY